jgi:hypothetical protein
MGDQHNTAPEQASANSLESSASLKRHHNGVLQSDTVEELPAKRLKADDEQGIAKSQDRRKGVVPIKPESVDLFFPGRDA